MVFYRCFFFTCLENRALISRDMLEGLVCPRSQGTTGYPLLFHNVSQCHILRQGNRVTVFISARAARATASIRAVLRGRGPSDVQGLSNVLVCGVKAEHVNRAALVEYYDFLPQMTEMFDRLIANRADLVSFCDDNVRVNLFGEIRGVVQGNVRRQASRALPPAAQRARRGSRAASPASSASSSTSDPGSPRTPESSPALSNIGEGPVGNFYSPGLGPRSPVHDPPSPIHPGSPRRDEPRSLVVVQFAPPPNPLANDPQHVADFRAFIGANGVQNPEFNARLTRFAVDHLRTMEGGQAQQLLGVLEPTGEQFVQDFRAYLNTHNHTDADFRARLDAFVRAYIERLHPDAALFNFAVRMFFAFQGDGGVSHQVFRDFILSVARA